jgi:hypothetical protein
MSHNPHPPQPTEEFMTQDTRDWAAPVANVGDTIVLAPPL